jgi:hypothetical protein
MLSCVLQEAVLNIDGRFPNRLGSVVESTLCIVTVLRSHRIIWATVDTKDKNLREERSMSVAL